MAGRSIEDKAPDLVLNLCGKPANGKNGGWLSFGRLSSLSGLHFPLGWSDVQRLGARATSSIPCGSARHLEICAMYKHKMPTSITLCTLYDQLAMLLRLDSRNKFGRAVQGIQEGGIRS